MANQITNKAESIDIFDQKNITAATLRKYLVGAQDVTDQEMAMFIAISRSQNLNPYTKEVYVIKYKNSPAQIVVSRDAYRKRAQKDPNFNGIRNGVIVENGDGSIEKLDGAFKKKNQLLIGAWCEVQMKNLDYPIYIAVSYDEYVQTKKDYNTGETKPNSMWASKPMTMLVKVAESQALRLAFPEMSGTYSEEELPPEETRPREVTEVTEPTREQIESFNKEEYANKKIEQLKAKANENNQENESQDDTKQGKIINDVTMEDF